MSYDLMVFDPLKPPRDRNGFMAWYDKQTEWSENHDYSHPEVTMPELQIWFQEMIMQFPWIDDPNYLNDIDNPKLAEYNFGRSIIYVAFAWSEAENAREAVFQLAQKHKVGFFDVSAENGQVWLVDDKGEYRCIHGDCSDDDDA